VWKVVERRGESDIVEGLPCNKSTPFFRCFCLIVRVMNVLGVGGAGRGKNGDQP